MRVDLYVPTKLYGFCEDDEGFRVFFHMGAFRPGGDPMGTPVPPVLGEPVDVEHQPAEEEGKAPRATSVTRLTQPTLLEGVVESFNPTRGWGFVKAPDGTSCYLHRSEVQDGRLPAADQRVQFYMGLKEGRPRACYVRVLERK